MAFKLGNGNINKSYLGSTEIKKAYLGNTLIFDNTGFEAEYQAVLDKAILEGFSLPTDIVQIAQNNLVKGLKSNNLWDKFETFGFFTDSNSDFARIDWKAPNNIYQSFNSPSYNLSSGFGFNANNQYINTNYKTITGDVNYNQTQVYWNASGYLYDGSFNYLLGIERSTPSSWAGFIREQANTNTWIGIPSRVDLNNPDRLQDNFYYSQGRKNATTSALRENNTEKSSSTSNVSSPISSDDVYLGCVNFNGGSPSLYWGGNIKYVFFLKDSISTHSANDNIIYSLLTSYYASL